MQNLTGDVSTIQIQLQTYPGVLRKISRDEGTVTISAFPAGTQREEDAVTFSILFVTPDEYPSSQAWLMSDNEAMCDMLNAVTDEFVHGASLELLVTRVLTLIGHEPDGVQHLFSSTSTVDLTAEGMDIDYGDVMTDEEMDFAYASDAEFEEDRDLMIALGLHQGLWEKHEQTYERDRQSVKGELSSKELIAEGRQIFDTKGAYKLLSKELMEIMKEESCDMVVEAIENDVYRWEVELGGFHTDSVLYADLMQLRALHGYSTVQLHVTFKRDLHPFYPPHVEVMRPRFLGPVSWAVSSHPMLQMVNWDPLKSQKRLLLDLKDFLQKHARVDLDSGFNSLVDYPVACYSPAEIQLARLEGLLEVRPRCASLPEVKELYDGREIKVDEARQTALDHQTNDPPMPGNHHGKGNAGKRCYWAAGTGFGHGYGGAKGKVWDAKKAAAAQHAHDIETQSLLSELRDSLAAELTAKSNDGASHSSSMNGMTYALIPTLNDSCLIPFLLKELGNISFTNMCERAEYYLSVVGLIRVICHPLSARILYTSLPEETSIFDCLNAVEQQAQCYTKVITQSNNPVLPPVPEPGGSSQHRRDTSTARNNADREERLGMKLAESIIDCVIALKEIHFSDPIANPTTSEEDRDKMEETNATEEYISTMKQCQIDFDPELSFRHHFLRDSSSEQSFPKDRLVRLSREIAGLGSLLPLNPSSSVLVRIDEQQQTLWSAMIVGPDDTPYSGGCFLFDVYFPSNYPSASPKVILTTTGGGKVRFNPNLYKNGKVCLSLLGTWSGAAGETWDPNASSIYQVLVSIQSLILVSEPYFNEPGYEETMHTEQGRNKSRQYNQDIREQTIHRAMIDYLRSPPKSFTPAILAHFKLRKDYILQTCHGWIEEGHMSHSAAHVSRLKNLVHELRTLLDGLI